MQCKWRSEARPSDPFPWRHPRWNPRTQPFVPFRFPRLSARAFRKDETCAEPPWGRLGRSTCQGAVSPVLTDRLADRGRSRDSDALANASSPSARPGVEPLGAGSALVPGVVNSWSWWETWEKRACEEVSASLLSSLLISRVLRQRALMTAEHFPPWESVPSAAASAPTGCSSLLGARAQAITEQYILTHVISGKERKRCADGTGTDPAAASAFS